MNIVIPKLMKPCINALNVDSAISPSASLKLFVPNITSVKALDAVSLNVVIPDVTAFILPSKGVNPSSVTLPSACMNTSLSIASSISSAILILPSVDLMDLSILLNSATTSSTISGTIEPPTTSFSVSLKKPTTVSLMLFILPVMPDFRPSN